jgi:hypothetical protein
MYNQKAGLFIKFDEKIKDKNGNIIISYLENDKIKLFIDERNKKKFNILDKFLLLEKYNYTDKSENTTSELLWLINMEFTDYFFGQFIIGDSDPYENFPAFQEHVRKTKNFSNEYDTSFSYQLPIAKTHFIKKDSKNNDLLGNLKTFIYTYITESSDKEILDYLFTNKHVYDAKKNLISNIEYEKLDGEATVILDNNQYLFMYKYTFTTTKQLLDELSKNMDENTKIIDNISKAGASGASLYFINENYFKYENNAIIVKIYAEKLPDNPYLSLDFLVFGENSNNINQSLNLNRTYFISDKYLTSIKSYNKNFPSKKIFLLDSSEKIKKLKDVHFICQNDSYINEFVISHIVSYYLKNNNVTNKYIINYYDSFVTKDVDGNEKMGLIMEKALGTLEQYLELIKDQLQNEKNKKNEKNEKNDTRFEDINKIFETIFYQLSTVLTQLKGDLNFTHGDLTINNIFCNYDVNNLFDHSKITIKLGDLDKSSLTFRNTRFLSKPTIDVSFISDLEKNILPQYEKGFFNIDAANKIGVNVNNINLITRDVEFVSYYARSCYIPIFMSYDFYIFILSLFNSSTIFVVYITDLIRITNEKKEKKNFLVLDIIKLLYSHKVVKDTLEPDDNWQANIKAFLTSRSYYKYKDVGLFEVLAFFKEVTGEYTNSQYFYNVDIDKIRTLLKTYAEDNKILYDIYKLSDPNINKISELFYMTSKDFEFNDFKLVTSIPMKYTAVLAPNKNTKRLLEQGKSYFKPLYRAIEGDTNKNNNIINTITSINNVDAKYKYVKEDKNKDNYYINRTNAYSYTKMGKWIVNYNAIIEKKFLEFYKEVFFLEIIDKDAIYDIKIIDKATVDKIKTIIEYYKIFDNINNDKLPIGSNEDIIKMKKIIIEHNSNKDKKYTSDIISIKDDFFNENGDNLIKEGGDLKKYLKYKKKYTNLKEKLNYF